MYKPGLAIIYCIALLLLCTTACKKDDQSVGQASFSAIDFPMAVGDQWVYQVTDYYSKITDTLTLIVNSVQSLPGGSNAYHCNILENGAIVDSGQYTVGNNLLSYGGLNPNSYSYFGDFKLTFPFVSGSSWIGAYLLDTVHVISETASMTVLGQQYQHVFSLKRAFALPGNYSLVQFMLLAPGVGVINQTLNIFNGGP